MEKKVKFDQTETTELDRENVAERRRQAQRNIAINRAAHFAVSNSESKVEVFNDRKSNSTKAISTPTGVVYAKTGSELESFDGVRGAFSIATQILNNAEETRKQREHQMDASLKNQDSLLSKDHGFLDEYDEIIFRLINNPKVGSYTKQRRQLTGPIDSLMYLATKVLVSAFHRVHTLDGMSAEARSLLAEELGKARKLDTHAALLLAGPGVDSLYWPECSCIDEVTLIRAIKQLEFTRQPDDNNNKCTNDLSVSTLRELCLRNCGHALGDKAVSTLVHSGNLQYLETLQITGCYKLSDAALVQLLGTSGAFRLKRLDLSADSRLGATGLTAISKLDNLHSLTLDNATQLTDACLAPLLNKSSPKLHYISLVGLIKVTDTVMAALIERFGAELHGLNISGCALLTKVSLVQIRLSCKQLCDLNISHLTDIPVATLLGLFLSSFVDCEDPTDDPIARMRGTGSSSPLGPLKLLHLGNLNGLTDDVLRHIVCSSGQTLETLDIGGCHQLTRRAAIMIASHCPVLKCLDISFVRSFSNEAMVYVLDSCPKLSLLHVWGCSQLLETFYNGHDNMDLLIVGQNRAI